MWCALRKYSSFTRLAYHIRPSEITVTFRTIVVSCQACKNELSRQGKIMQKLMGKKKKKHFGQSDHTSYIQSTPVFGKPQQSKKNFRRLEVLNTVFMEYITGIMATGEISEELINLGIVVNRVNVSPDYSNALVYWVGPGGKIDSDIEEILSRISGKLRHELTQLRVIGRVPNIEFIKDKKYGNLMQVEELLAKADFGEDFVPTHSFHDSKSQVSLKTEFDPELKARIIEAQKENDLLSEESPLADNESASVLPLNKPPMRMDVLQLDHEVIMNRIKQEMKKAKAPHRQLDKFVESTSRKEEVYNESLEICDEKKRIEAFSNFLKSRKILEKKLKTDARNSDPLQEYELEKQNWLQDETRSTEFDTEEEEDYFDEIPNYDAVTEEDKFS